MSDTCHFGPIIKHKNFGYGFKVSFNDEKVAQKYKEMMGWIIKDDGIIVNMDKGYYDGKE